MFSPAGRQQAPQADASQIGFGEFFQNDIQVESWAEKGVRKHMEDEHLIIPSLCSVVPSLPKHLDVGIYAIFDGHGGRQSATFSKQSLPVEIAEQISSLPAEVSIPFPDAVIKMVISTACQKVDGRIAAEISSSNDGCTAVILVKQRSHITIATIGDAAGYLCMASLDKTIHAVPLSEAHKPWVIKEKQRILNAGGTVENGRVNGNLEVTRSIGDLSLKRYGVLCTPTFTKLNIEDVAGGQFIMLGCDGFWTSWTALEAVTKANDMISKEKRRINIDGLPDAQFDLKAICKELVEFAIVYKMSQDNVSLICMRMLNSSSTT